MLSANGYDNTDADPNNIISLLRTQNYMTLVSLYQQKTTRNYQNFFAKDLKAKSDNKNKVNEYRITFF